MVLKITEDGMRRLEAHVKNAQDDLSYDDSRDVEDQMDEMDMEDIGVTYEILSNAHDAFMTAVYEGVQKAISDGYLEKNIKGHMLNVLETFDDEMMSIRDQLVNYVKSN